MLEVLTGSQINFQPLSDTDGRLKGEIVLKNSNPKLYLIFKIKSTDVNAFEADPSKGILGPRENISIKIFTTSTVDSQYAITLSKRNKFLVEYVLINNKPDSAEEITSKLRGSSVQSVKLFINTDSVRGSRSIKPFNQASISGTNKYSFHSMGQNNNPLPFSSASAPYVGSNNITDQMDQLKSETEFLEKQRARLSKDMNGMLKTNKKQGGFIKYVLILGIGVIIGNFSSKYTGLQTQIKNQINSNQFFTSHPNPPPEAQKQQGFFSIFNFGQDNQPSRSLEQQKKSWWNIL